MRFSIAQRVGLGLLLMILLIVLLIITNAATVTSYRNNVLVLSNETLPTRDALADLHESTNATLWETLQYILTAQPEHLAHRSEEIALVRQLVSQLRAAEQTDLVGVERDGEVMNALALGIDDMLFLTDQLIAQRQRGTSPDIAEMSGQIETSEDSLRTLFDMYEEVLEEQQALAVNAAQQDPLDVTRFIAALVLLVAVGLFVLLLRWVVWPLGDLRAAALAVAAGDRQRKVRASSLDEIGDLGRAFNTMIDQVGEQERKLRERASSLEDANATQSRLLETVRALDVPVIPVGVGVLTLPLIGTIDQARATQLTERLLEAVYRERARTVILDVTGLATADESTARYLIATAQQVSLLGARLMLTGVRANLAHALANLDFDLSTIEVRATLRDAIADALVHPLNGAFTR